MVRPGPRGPTSIYAHGHFQVVIDLLGVGALILRLLHGARNTPEVLGSDCSMIAIRVTWSPNHLDPFGIYRRLSSPSGIFWR